MMMNSGTWEGNPLGYTTVEMLLDDVSKQMASSNFTRYSRGTPGQKAGGSTRVVKPNSASNSPRTSMGLGRRRTVMADGAYRRRLALVDQQVAVGGFISNDGLHVPTRSARPVSWHPASHLAPQSVRAPYTTQIQQHYQMIDLSPTPAVYSGYTSPASTFSPLSMPYTGYGQQQFSYQEPTPSYQTTSTFSAKAVYQPPQLEAFIPQQTTTQDSSMYSHFDWNDFSANGFENSSTAPPTPENFLPIQHPDPTFPAEGSIPYHPLSEDEDEGEELIGMGLYDAPELPKAPSLDPHLDNYKAYMMSLLGSRKAPEPTGKGLKLEETWNPPTSDDEEEDDDEADGEGEDEEPAQHAPVTTIPQSYSQNRWL